MRTILVMMICPTMTTPLSTCRLSLLAIHGACRADYRKALSRGRNGIPIYREPARSYDCPQCSTHASGNLALKSGLPRRNATATTVRRRNRKKKDAKRTQFSALALSKTRFPPEKRTQTNPKRTQTNPSGTTVLAPKGPNNIDVGRALPSSSSFILHPSSFRFPSPIPNPQSAIRNRWCSTPSRSSRRGTDFRSSRTARGKPPLRPQAPRVMFTPDLGAYPQEPLLDRPVSRSARQ